MATTSNPNITHEDKGKMIITEPEITAISDLKPIHCNKTIEAVVYHKWTSKHVHARQPMKYCCILMDKQARLGDCASLFESTGKSYSSCSRLNVGSDLGNKRLMGSSHRMGDGDFVVV
ncbi:hypothetical protein Tco_1178402 [Tanacetum coccineum]